MAKKYPGLYLYFDWIDALEDLPAKKAMTVITNLRDYARDGVEPPPMDGYAGTLQALLAAQMKRSIANAQNGRLGGLSAQKKALGAKENADAEGAPRFGMTPEELQAVTPLDFLKLKARFKAEEEAEAAAVGTCSADGEDVFPEAVR